MGCLCLGMTHCSPFVFSVCTIAHAYLWPIALRQASIDACSVCGSSSSAGQMLHNSQGFNSLLCACLTTVSLTQVTLHQLPAGGVQRLLEGSTMLSHMAPACLELLLGAASRAGGRGGRRRCRQTGERLVGGRSGPFHDVCKMYPVLFLLFSQAGPVMLQRQMQKSGVRR